jgi:hypothetical protein
MPEDQKFDEFIKQARNAEANGNWAIAADNYRKAVELRRDDQEIERKRKRAAKLSNFRVPKDLNMVVFSACDDDGAVERHFQKFFGSRSLRSGRRLRIYLKARPRRASTSWTSLV